MRRTFLAASLMLASCSAAPAQEVAAFYAGKTIRLVVGVDVGSGYDVNARLLARHMGAHIPGNPAFIVQNQPGAGSVTMTSQLYANGPFDGTAIGAAFAGMPTIPLLQPGGSRFDPTKLIWLGNTNRETHVTYVWHTAPVQSLAQARTQELIMGAQAPGSSQVDFPLVADALLGFKFKVVPGYQSTSKINLALESGEVQGTIAAWTTLKTLELRLAGGPEDQDHRPMGVAAEPGAPRHSQRAGRAPRRRPSAMRCAWCWRGSTSAGRSSCRRMCRPIGWRRCAPHSTPPCRIRTIGPRPTSSRSTSTP